MNASDKSLYFKSVATGAYAPRPRMAVLVLGHENGHEVHVRLSPVDLADLASQASALLALGVREAMSPIEEPAASG